MKRKVAVVGGGIVGTALARHLSKNSSLKVTLFEKESGLGRHQSSRNSGVVHAGLYYRSDSLKARLVQEGRQLLQEFCKENKIPYLERGKVVIATNDAEIARLAGLEKRAYANKVPKVSRITRNELKKIEPYAEGIEALYSPKTAVVDFGLVIDRASEQFRSNGGSVVLNRRIISVSERFDRARIRFENGEQEFDKVYVCAGIHADSIFEGELQETNQLVPFRGEYLELTAGAAEMIKGLIYPVPNPKFPFLGVHFTRGHDNCVHIGPNATLALAREGYSISDFNLQELRQYALQPGTLRLVLRNPVATFDQVMSSVSRRYFVSAARKLVPELRNSDLAPRKWSGVRAQAVSRKGKLVDDFLFQQSRYVTVVKNAPSPAATASFAIAKYIVEELEI